METMIDIKDLRVAYDETIIIDSLNVAIPKGKLTMIIGTNGCGKSTLLKSIARIIHPKKGHIKIDGRTIKQHAFKELAKKMAVLPQSPVVPSGLLVKELVAYGRFPYLSPMGGLTCHDIEMVDWALQVTNMSEFSERSVDSLSGGQRQRVWIAMALAQETEIIVLDEPTTYLDMAHQLEILSLLKKLNEEQGRTIIVVLHELNNATKFADYIIGMKKGEIVFEGKPLEVVNEENLFKLYGIHATLQLDESGQYPICVDFELAHVQ